MTNKDVLRHEIKNIKRNISFDIVSDEIQSRLYDIDLIKTSECIMLYKALSDEVVTDVLYDRLKKDGKVCCFPVVSGNEIIIKKDDGFKRGAFGILEPCGAVIEPCEVDVVIVPGVAFDLQCRRLGRGGGYYDRLLSRMSAFKIGVCPDVQLLPDVPSEIHDICVDMVVTEKRMICNG